MLDGKEVFRRDFHGSGGQHLVGAATHARRRRDAFSRFRFGRRVAPLFQARRVRLVLVLDSHERRRECAEGSPVAEDERGESRELEGVRDHEPHGLTAELDSRVVERTKRFARRRDVVAVALGRRGEPRCIVVSEDLQDARHTQCLGGVDSRDSAPGDLARHDIPVDEAGSVHFRGVLRGARHLGAAVDSTRRLSDIYGRHQAIMPPRRSAHERWRAWPARF